MKELIWKEARIIASRVSHGEFAAAIDALSRGLLKPEIMITDILPLEEANKGFELLEKIRSRHLRSSSGNLIVLHFALSPGSSVL